MDQQPQKEREHHLETKWDLQNIQIKKSVQCFTEVMTYDHQEFSDSTLYPFKDGRYRDELKIKQTSNQIDISHRGNRLESSFYLDKKLDNSKNYIVSLSFERHKDADVAFGLVSKGQKDKELIGICYRDCNGGDTNVIVKGQIQAKENEYQAKEVQFRLNISKGYWKVATPHGYANIQQLNKEVKLDPSDGYYFAFILENSSGLIIKDIYEVSEYHHHD